ncbi:hypothetical protein [Lacinutrix sp. Bg11-31]|uniref:hypothetical protein n=1 Tax=Lacinutrix sp. Bg11-31 TaxID=2057808 RepID=UPI000C318EDD|nr:hypothetical protein [Lacinutrix sp. Bg11-31]AUC82456.1 hypothetical protein CW733_10060 [Lacinutrix sp. Bg11-31]
MKNEIQINNIKFWVDQNIIYCKFYNDFDKNYFHDGFEDIFYEAISILSNGTYLPVIFDLRGLKSLVLVKLFKLLSNSSKLEKTVLSKVFLIESQKRKIILSFYLMFRDTNVPNLIFMESDLAIKYSNHNYALFNSLSYDH